MKRSILAFILALLLCIPALSACSKKEDNESASEKISTEKPTLSDTEAPTNEATDPIEPEQPSAPSEPNKPSTPTEPEKVVTDLTIANRVYSYYNAKYDMLAVAFNEKGSPLALELYNNRLSPYHSSSFCSFEYDEYGKISAFVFKNDSVIHEELFGRCEDISLKVTRHDKKGRPLKTEAANLVTLSFEYNDDAKTSTMSFTHVRMPGAYTLTFDELGRLISLNDFGAKSEITYNGATATVSDPFYSPLGMSFVLTYDAAKMTELKEVTSSGVAMAATYTYGEKGLCSEVLCKYGERKTEKYVFAFDKNDRISKQEYFLTDSEYPTETKINEITYAYDLRGKMTEASTLSFTDAQNGYISSVTQNHYGSNGFLNSSATYTKDQEGYNTEVFLSSYYESGALKMTELTKYNFYLKLSVETIEYDENGRPTHVSSSKYDSANHEAESENAVYTYSDIDGTYTKISREYSYSLCHTQTTETYRSDVLREKEIITYDENMDVIDVVTTVYDKDGNVVS